MGEAPVVGLVPDAIGVTLDLQLQPRLREKQTGDAGELLSRTWLQRRAAGIEQHIGKIDDQSSRGFACFENRVELLPQLIAKCGLFALGPISAPLRLSRPGLCERRTSRSA